MSPPGGVPFDRRLLAVAGPARRALSASVAVGLVSTAAVAAQGVFLGFLLASAVPGAEVTLPRRTLAFGLACSLAVRAACGTAEEIVGRRGAARVKEALRDRLVAAAVRGRLGGAGPGEVATLTGRGLDALDPYLARCLPDLVLAVATPVVLVAVIGALDWVSAVVVVVAIGLFPVFGGLVGRTTGERARARWAEVSALGDHLVDLFEGLPVLRAYGRTATERDRLVGMSERLRAASRATLRLAFLSALVLDTLASVATALVAVPIGLRLVDARMSLGPGLAALLLTPEVFLPLRRASAEFHESAEGRAAAGRVLDLLDPAPPAPAPPAPPARAPAAVTAPGAAGRGPSPAGRPSARRTGRSPLLALEGVRVERPGRAAPVLDRVDLVVDPGEVVALVGPNGAGKSTLLAVALGLVRPAAGHVRVDGLPLDPDDPSALAAWRSRCSFLADRPALLPASLADNLRLADARAGDGRLCRALADAGADGLVGRLPEGLATPIGPGGHALSAGERQRVGLARALLRDADLLLLDEPTAHLDPDGEAALLARLAARLRGRAALVVTHRPSALVLAHRVVRLEGGRLVEVDPALALTEPWAAPAEASA